MSDEDRKPVFNSDDEEGNIVKHEEPDNRVTDGSYDVEDRDVNEFDDDNEEDDLEEQDTKKEFHIGSKRPLDEQEDPVDNPGDGESAQKDVPDAQDNAQEDAQDDEQDEDEDEDEEDEDEEEDDVGSRKRKRRRANQFIDIEAEVDDEEEEDIDEDDEEAEMLREQFIADDRVETTDGKDDVREHQDDRLHRQFDRRRQEAEDQDAEVLAETLKQRYRKTHSVYRGDTTASGTVSQKLLMPSINDPAIYAIRCSPGREKDLVRRLYEKKKTLARGNNPLEILTVFQRDSFKGYIYIEAKRPEAIERALAGMVNIYAKQRLLVPVREYPDLLKQVKSSDVELVPGIYVRITRGKYKGDLAIVDNLSENGLDVRCKLVPRLDYGKNDDFDKDGKRIKSKIRPIPRLFNEQEARMYDAEYLQPGRGPRSYIYRGEEYHEGFLYKDLKLQYIQTKDVHPRLEELDRFQTGNSEEDGLDLAAIAASLKNKNNSESGQSSAFQSGDKVEVRRGEQAKTVGKVLTSSLNEITILVTDSGDPKFVNQHLTVPVNDLRKVFAPGDHVKVIEGKHSDETGLVIRIDNDSVVLLSDQTNEDVRVFANYLIKATDAYSTADSSSSKYDIKDLVQLNASTVGVIVKADKGLFGIITSDGRSLSVKPSGIASKLQLSRREQIATDKNGSTIRIGDTVREVLGDKKREGAIIHIYKNSLFIKSHEIVENLGIFVTSSLNVSTIATKDSIVSKSLGPDLSRMNPNVKAPPPIATAGLKTSIRGRDKLLYKDVLINGGNYKGLMGKVTDADDVDARIELHTKSKKIKVNKTRLSVLVRGEAIPYLRFIGASDAPRGGNNPPGNWGNNGFTQPRTSAPAFSSSGNRSAWGGGATPAAGSASTWGGASSWGGGKTPAYSSGGASAWGGANAGGASAWGSNNNGNASAWGSGGNAGGASAWGSGGGASSWGKNSGKTSTWGKNGGNNSTWGSGGGNSSWGNGGGNSTWGSGGNKNGGSSAWGR